MLPIHRPGPGRGTSRNSFRVGEPFIYVGMVLKPVQGGDNYSVNCDRCCLGHQPSACFDSPRCMGLFFARVDISTLPPEDQDQVAILKLKGEL